MRTVDYLDAIKARHNLSSDYQLWKLTGWSKATISAYRNKPQYFSDEHALLVAELLDLDPAEVLADVYAERTKNSEVRAVWARVAQVMGRHAAGVLMAVLVVGFGAGFPPLPVEAAAQFPSNLVSEGCILCQMALAALAVATWLNRRVNADRAAA